MKLNIQDLAIEVTRRCNMNCAHCMRGKAENKDLDLEKLDKFLENVNSIGTITFTGGEPTLNVDAIEHTLNKCKELGIEVYDFYLVTNGKTLDNKFISLMIEWYMYCFDCNGCAPECTGIALSQDKYHIGADETAIAKLSALSFFSKENKKTDWNKSMMIDLGNARSITSDNKRKPSYYPPEVEEVDDLIYVREGNLAFTCDGDILFDCDYEYESTDDIKACDYSNAIEEFHKMATDPEYEFVV